jgi:hypothetical protein
MMWGKVIGVILFICLGVVIFFKHIFNSVDEYYSPGYISQSIAVSHRKKVFISKPTLIRKVIHWEKSDYAIREAWIEQTTKSKYDWIFFHRIVLTGHRLILAIETTGKPPGKDFIYVGYTLVCNNSINMTSVQFGSPMLLSTTDILSPFPDSIDCILQKR